MQTSDFIYRFSLKFQKIVQDEQDANFITKLHRGKLDIIPWPVIGSKQFYMLFPTIQKRLDQQEVTHKTAGEFLQTLKTLMAKLKVKSYFHTLIRIIYITHRQMTGVHCPVSYLRYGRPLGSLIVFLFPFRKPCCTPCPPTPGYASKSYFTWHE
jgi:hypothetical protein